MSLSVCVCVCVCCVPMVAHTYIVKTPLCGYFKNPPEYTNVPMPGEMQSSTVVAQLLGLFLFNSVPLRTRMWVVRQVGVGCTPTLSWLFAEGGGRGATLGVCFL